MKYFTPDLIERLGCTAAAVAGAAQEEWEGALQRYESYLKSVGAELPKHIREFSELLLHDAIIWSIVQQQDQLIMVLRKDIPPQNVLILTYFLTQEPIVDKNALPACCRGPVMDFQYDELEIMSENDRKIYSQSILFGNGWEMRLCFHDVQVSSASPVYPLSDTVLVPVAATAAKSA
jgi:hypothetical protein